VPKKNEYQRLLTLDEAADLFQVSLRGIKRRVDEGSIRAFKIGRLVRIAPKDLAAYLEDHEREPPSAGVRRRDPEPKARRPASSQ